MSCLIDANATKRMESFIGPSRSSSTESAFLQRRRRMTDPTAMPGLYTVHDTRMEKVASA
jgi:hypothetical protein